MKTEIVVFEHIDSDVVYYIGTNANDNHSVIDKGTPNDLWFHIANTPSCHVVVKLPDECDKKELRSIIKKGSLLCKQNTKRFASLDNVEIMYTPIKNISKTHVAGEVIVSNYKSIFV
jgi:predicted ribosome quality control (RQC) complex YloA/Tae2 family protein